MKKLSILLLSVFSVALSFSQSIEQRANSLSMNFQNHLQISNEQMQELATVIKNKLTLVAELSKSKDQENAKTTLMLEKRKYFSEIKAILTEEQFNAWQVLRSEQSAAMNNNQPVEKPVIDADLDMLIKKK
jgi:hypothetical protein